MEFTFTPTAQDWARFTPELVLGATALLVLLVDLVLPARHRAWLAMVSLLGVIGASVAVVWLFTTANFGEAFFHMVTSDRAALYADAILIATYGLAVLFSPLYIERQAIRNHGEYYALLALATAGMMLMASATNLMTIFVGLELLSLCLYILSAFVANRFASQEAGMKYFLLSSFASGFLLYGMSLTYGATGATSLDGIRAFLDGHPFTFTGGYGPLLTAGFAMMAVGFCFKVSGIPFHAWTPDVYVGAPTTVTAFMSVGTKVAAFFALARVFEFALAPLVGDWTPIFWTVAVLSMVFGNLLAVTQSDVKRLLAYSSIANAGYIIVGIATGTLLGLTGVFVYLACYSVMNLGAFGVVLMLERGMGQGTTLTDYAGLGRRQPLMAASLAICLFALAGFPPSAGFIAKWGVFYGAIVGAHLELAIIGAVTSVFGMFYYLRVIWAMYFTSSAPAVAPEPAIAAAAPATAVPAPEREPETVGAVQRTPAPTPVGAAVALSSRVRGQPGTVVAVARETAVAATTAASALSTPAAAVALGVAVVLTIVIGIVPGPLFDAATRAAASLIH